MPYLGCWRRGLHPALEISCNEPSCRTGRTHFPFWICTKHPIWPFSPLWGFCNASVLVENMRKVYPANISKWAFQMFHHQLKQPLLVFWREAHQLTERKEWCVEGVLSCGCWGCLFLIRNSNMALCFKRFTAVHSTNGSSWSLLSFIQHCTIQCFNAHIL